MIVFVVFLFKAEKNQGIIKEKNNVILTFVMQKDENKLNAGTLLWNRHNVHRLLKAN